MHIPDQESRGHIQPTYLYILIGVVLLALTVATVAASYVDWGVEIGGGFGANVAIAMAIATLKAYFVLMYFMHMKYESRLVWGFGIIYPLLLFALLIGASALDIFLRVIPQSP